MILEFKNVSGISKEFKLKNISFSVEPGFITGITGKNGAGKTTLFHYIMEPEKNYTGDIMVGDKKLHEHHAELMNIIGYVSEDNRFFMEKTGKENVDLLSVFYLDFDTELFYDVMKEMKLSSMKELKNMSRGEYLKFQLAFAIAHKSKLYLLDEITGGMDPIFRKELYQMLQEILMEEDTAIIMTTHIKEEIEMRMDYVGVMEEGTLVSFQEVGGEPWIE